MEGRPIFVREDREQEVSAQPTERPARPPRPAGAERPERAPRPPRPERVVTAEGAAPSPVQSGEPGRKVHISFTLSATKPLIPPQLFVSNLAYSISWQDMKDLFAEFGVVVRADVFQERPGRSKGVGVVEMSTAEEAQAAITGMTGREVRGRVLTVREDRPPKAREVRE